MESLYNKYWWNCLTYGSLCSTDYYFTFVFSWKENPQRFRNFWNQVCDALNSFALSESCEDFTKICKVIQHQSPQTISPLARFAPISLTNSLYSSKKMPIFCLSCVCRFSEVALLLVLTSHFSRCLSHFLKVSHLNPFF